jgi:hypothetical protein
MAIGTTTPARAEETGRLRRRTILVEFSPKEMDVLDHDCFRTPIINVDGDKDVPHGFG